MRLAAAILALFALLAHPAEARARFLVASALPESGVTRIFIDRLQAELRTAWPDQKVELAMAGMLGGETELLDLLKSGEYELHLGVLHGAVYYPELDATLVPFLFPDYPAIERFLDGPVGRRMADALARRGNAVLLGSYDLGQRWTTASKRFETVEELHDIKIRMPEIPLWIKIWGGMGAAVVPIAAPDVPAAIRAGTIDAQENTLSNIFGRRSYQGQAFLIETAHHQSHVSVMAQKGFWHKLLPAQRRLLQDAVERASDAATDALRELDRTILDRLVATGMTRVVPRPEFRQKALPVVEKAARDMLAPGVYEAALAAIEAR
ncbi:TRAP-type C4-dicarboxylate transport system substrate-binding protein [Stella humosa]|uniref:TRAP-type C4-dicarboxylate transport system substrate-binding protein n=1 Tax=Stella humosa TaxID=94 RepID=A0A3N1KUQ3_9PROT|nr:TRAP transporter substrate-binding protein [Stella humosa]ROP84311.1 TRAP-type C4-dicarboxylate transport system substrate-binding protein [Stella humosa]BBK33825.1 hypothetical protein STHU_44590 [Stella humosa]